MRCLHVFLVPLLFALGCQDKQDTPQPDPARGSPSSPPAGGSKFDPSKGLTGSIRGKEFVPDQIKLSGRQLTIRKGKDFFADMEIWFQLPAKDGKSYEGKSWSFTGDKFENPTLTIKAKEGKDAFGKTDFAHAKDYTMSLTITKHTGKVIEGLIDLKVTNPPNTMLLGKFTGVAEKDVSEPLDADDAPYVQGNIVMKGDWQSEALTAGFLGRGADGKEYSNSAGTKFQSGGGGWVTGASFAPQLTSLVNDAKTGPGFKHTQVKPGDYLLYVKRGGVMAAWKKVTVKAGDQQNVDLTVDLANVGTLNVTIPEDEANAAFERRLQLVPNGIGQPTDFIHFAFDAAEVKKGQTNVVVNLVPPGKYLVRRGDREADAEVVAGKETAVTLMRRVDKK